MPLKSALLLLAVVGAGGYIVYPDEYAHDELPGNAHDARGLPNLPFSVNSDRRNDGVSSASPLNPSSPSFPYYEYLLDPTVADRANHTRLLRRSQRAQGVAGRGAGAYERESAVRALYADAHAYWVSLNATAGAASNATPPNATVRRALRGKHSELAYDLGPPPAAAFLVRAATRWNPSAFAIQRGETYRVFVEDLGGHKQHWLDGYVRVDTEGYEAHYDARSRCWVAAGRCRASASARKRLSTPGARWFSLVCGVGEAFWKLEEVALGKERYMPLREDELIPTLFEVGANKTFTAEHTGELICFANDAEGQYWDNDGAVRVNVTRVSWPPAPDFPLEQLLDDGKRIYAERVQRDKNYDGAAGATARGPTKQIDTPVIEGIHTQLPGY